MERVVGTNSGKGERERGEEVRRKGGRGERIRWSWKSGVKREGECGGRSGAMVGYMVSVDGGIVLLLYL